MVHYSYRIFAISYVLISQLFHLNAISQNTSCLLRLQMYILHIRIRLTGVALVTYKDTKAKCCQTKYTCKGTSRQRFIRVYRLEIQSVMLVFSTQLCELLPLSPSLWFNFPPPPLSCLNKYTLYTYTVCMRGVIGFWASDK
jgi:hypothetical protein